MRTEADIVSSAIRQARMSNARLRGLGINRVTSTPDPDPNNPGGTIYDDGGGNIAIVDADGVTVAFKPGLGNKVAWMQTPVYIAAGAGLVLGVLGTLAYQRKRK